MQRLVFREKDANPAATFSNAALRAGSPRRGVHRESRDIGSLNLFRNPYVAKVTQGDGPYGTVTINPKGAFFSAMAEWSKRTKKVALSTCASAPVGAWDRMPEIACRRRPLPFLHEFGHVLDILPTDQDNVDGNPFKIPTRCCAIAARIRLAVQEEQQFQPAIDASRIPSRESVARGRLQGIPCAFPRSAIFMNTSGGFLFHCLAPS